MSDKYDVIVIGAGIGGLAAAANLSRNGKKVLVLERIQMPGGCAVNFQRGRFEFDSALHLLNGLRKGGVSYRLLEECGIENKVEFLKPKCLYRSIFPDTDIRVPQCDPKSYVEELGNLFPKEKENINELFDLMDRLFNRIWNIGDNKISPVDFVKYVDKTCQDVFDEFELSEKVGAIVSQLWPFLGLPPKQLSFFIFVSTIVDYTRNGGYYPKGGAQAISNTLAEVITENGGILSYGNSVTKACPSNRKAH